MADFIRPADPIEWYLERTYEALTLVANGGDGYVSKKSVPANTQLTNTEYWVPVKSTSGTADEAMSVAQDALSKATAAQSAANSAQSTATEAQNDASSALQAANTASQTASTASQKASDAASDASDALDAAKAAQDMTLMQQGSYPIQ